MAEFLKGLIGGGWMRATMLVAVSLAPATGAERMPDPTRPPDTRARILQQGVERIPSQEMVLQSVLVGPERRIAVISGQSVGIGDRFRGLEVVDIRDGEVILRNGSRVQKLKLFPQVRKRWSDSDAGLQQQ